MKRNLFYVLIVVFSSLQPIAQAEVIPITNLLSCKNPTEMNCIVSLSATFESGLTVSAKQTGKSNSWDSKDFEQNVRTYKAEEWAIPGLKNSSGTNTLVTQVWVPNPASTPRGIDYGAMDITLFASLWDSPQDKLTSPLCSTSGLIVPCLFPPEFPSDVLFTIVINTNLIQPGLTTGKISEASFKSEQIIGGMQYTISGKPINIPVNLPDAKNTNPGEFPQALAERNYWTLAFVDSRSWYQEKTCSSGNPLISTNAQISTTPEFDPVSKEITLRVSSPHLSSDGVTPSVGDFQVRIPTSGVSCLWGVTKRDLLNAAEVSVTYQDGVSTVASLVTKLEKDEFIIRASGFHYSSPTLRLKFKDSQTSNKSNSQASSVPQRVASIKCSKQKVIKKVVGVKPTCPKGFKKVA